MCLSFFFYETLIYKYKTENKKEYSKKILNSKNKLGWKCGLNQINFSEEINLPSLYDNYEKELIDQSTIISLHSLVCLSRSAFFLDGWQNLNHTLGPLDKNISHHEKQMASTSMKAVYIEISKHTSTQNCLNLENFFLIKPL